MANTGLFLNPSTVRRPRTVLVLLSDGQLLERFALKRDQQAFATLVQRHGPLVRGVCQRVLQNPDDAEDAYQAAFVVLARKAESIKKCGSLASWLYKVAYRIALRARANKARRRDQELHAPVASASLPAGDVAQREVDQLLDDEVHQLPEKYRTAILLCYLQGKTNEEAAQLLGLPLGTVKIRLARGRELLRKRLLRRGLGLSAIGFFFALLENPLQAAESSSAIEAAAQHALAHSTLDRAGVLADSLLRGMCLTKLKIAAALLLLVTLFSLADGLTQTAVATPTAIPSPPSLPDSPSSGQAIPIARASGW